MAQKEVDRVFEIVKSSLFDATAVESKKNNKIKIKVKKRDRNCPLKSCDKSFSSKRNLRRYKNKISISQLSITILHNTLFCFCFYRHLEETKVFCRLCRDIHNKAKIMKECVYISIMLDDILLKIKT